MYPSYNPFSPHGTMVIEGSKPVELDLPTLIRPSISRLARLLDRYRFEYGPSSSEQQPSRDDDNALVSEADPGQGGEGRAIALHGDHGTGKTHALAHGINLLRLEGPGLPEVRTVYVRADGPDFLSLYRKLMTQVTFQELRSLCAGAQATYAREVFALSRKLSPAKSMEAIQKVDSEADWVDKAFAATELQATAVLDRQSQDLLDREGIGRKEFTRVIPNLLNSDLEDFAYRWIIGDELAAGELRQLGITENIQDPLRARMGIQALLIMHQKAGKPLALLLDQAEAFVTAEDGSLDQANVGILRAIVESVPKISGLLVVAIREATWAKLPPDLVQRFGPSEILTAGLKAEEATDLVAVYVSKWHEKGRERTFPFCDDAVRQVLRNSGGNIRLFVQLCSLLFTVAAPDQAPIDEKLASKVLSEETSPVPDKASLRGQLGELLRAAHVPFEEGLPLGRTTVDFAVRDGRGGFRAFIVVTDALFGTQEVALARKTLDLVRDAQSHPAEVILVVCGYMSPELTSELGEVHRVVVASAATGREQLAKLVNDLSTPLIHAAVNAPSDLEARLAAIQASLTALESERASESEALQERVADLARTQVARRQSGELDEARRQWGVAEESISRDTRAAREKRQEAELAELERLRASAERDRQQLVILVLTVVTIGLIVAGSAITSHGFQATNWATGALIGLAGGVLASAAVLVSLYRPSSRRELEGPVASVEELNRLARAYTERPRPTHRLLRSRNPHLRYTAALAAERSDASLRRPGQDGPYSTGQSEHRALASERSAIVRRALVRSIATGRPADLGLDQVLSAVTPGDPAASAIFDSAGGPAHPYPDERVSLDPQALDKLGPGFDTLAGLYGFRIRRNSLLNEFVIAARDGASWETGGRWLEEPAPARPEFSYPAPASSIEPAAESSVTFPARELAEAYLRDDDIALLMPLSTASERDLRAAAAKLSPFDAGRLGTFDWLVKIEEIDQMYLFFRKCLFYLGRGLPAS